MYAYTLGCYSVISLYFAALTWTIGKRVWPASPALVGIFCLVLTELLTAYGDGFQPDALFFVLLSYPAIYHFFLGSDQADPRLPETPTRSSGSRFATVMSRAGRDTLLLMNAFLGLVKFSY